MSMYFNREPAHLSIDADGRKGESEEDGLHGGTDQVRYNESVML